MGNLLTLVALHEEATSLSCPVQIVNGPPKQPVVAGGGICDSRNVSLPSREEERSLCRRKSHH